MITNTGKDIVKKYFAGLISQIGGVIVVGTGDAPATLLDTKLSFETARIQVKSISADLDNNRIVFKGLLPPGLTQKVYEVGLYQGNVPNNKTINLGIFEGSVTSWVSGALVATNARRGAQTLKIDAAVSGSTVASLSQQSLDLSNFALTDSVAMAFYADANLSNVKLRFGTDASNYRQYTFSTVSAGYNEGRVSLSSFVDVGTVDLGVIQYIAVVPTATATGPTSLYLDGIRLEDNQDTNTLVSRHVLVTPATINASIPTDIEYSLGISV